MDTGLMNLISGVLAYLIDQFAKSSISHISLSQAEVESSKAIPRESIILQVTVTETSNNIEKRLKCKTITALLNNETDFLNTFFTSLGQLYLYGVNMQIKKLYPEVDYPVPRGTPMLSYLFDWDHSQTWNIYTAAQKNLNCVCSFVIDPFSQDSKDSYILDHVIDGRCIYPFTGYLVLAWKAICKLKMIDFNKTSVILENVRVLRATVISKPVKFIVSVTLANGLFEIMEEDQLVACGTVKILTDVSGDRLPFYYENLDKYPIRSDAHEETFELNDSDLYKEFRMRGYEYGESFRGIRKACNTGELATLIWTGNWVTFIDSLLQTNLVLEKAYTMRVPIRLEYLRIDPVRHVSSVYEFDCLKVVDARNNIQTFGAIAGGVETYGLVCQTLPIRTWLNRKVTLEWGNFSPYFDDKCLNDFPDIKQRLHQYNQCCRGMALKIISCFANKNELLNDNVQTFQRIPNLANGVDYDFCFNLQEKPAGSLLSFLQNFYKNISSSNSVINADSFNQYYQSFVENVENDILLQFTWNHPVGIDMLDICLQNTPGHYYKIAAIEPYSLNVLKTIKHFTLTHPLADGEFHLIGPKVGQFNEEQRKSLGFEIFGTDLCSDDEPLSDIYKNRDVIVLDRVLHRQKNVVKYLRKIGELLENNGFLMVSEVTDNFETALLVDFFENHFQSTKADNVEESRIYDTFLKHDDWLKVFETAGYHVIAYRGDDLMTSIYILRKIKTQPLKPCFIYVNDFREFSWIERVQKELELRVNDPPENTIVLFTNETRDSGLGGLAQSFREEYVKNNRIRVFNDISMIAHDGSSTIDIKDSCVQDQLKFDLLINSFRDGKWGTIRRFLFAEEEINLFDDTEHAVINTTVHGDLSSLSWITSANKFFDFKPDKSDDVEMVSVYYAALNFRDVMVASGRLAGDFIPKVEGLDEDCLLGIEFVGRFNKSGSRVMGISPIAQAFATTVVGDKRFCWDVPDEWTLKQAATVPVAYSTAYYSLLVRGEMERGETVLIHAGTGSVGLAAITLALAYGCKVFTTCSSREKKQFLLDRFPQLDETCIGNSRNQDFELQIMQITDGRGVDLILNSLSETLLRASVRCLARNGRFLEIGKFDLAMNNSLAMEMFAKNATFHGIVMDLLSYPLNQGWELATRKLAEDIKIGIVVPLPATVFDMNRPEEAFRFIAQGKHMGKVLLQIRQEERDIFALPRPIFVKAHRRTYCHPQHVYLLIGGLGGIGLELGHWLINRGAKKLLFTSRFGVKTGYQKRCLEFWKKAGVLVKVSTLNVVSLNETYELIKEANRLGRVGGVFNLSMVLKDTLFENQTVKNFQDTCAPKVDGTRHLDKITRELCKGHEMKWFVYFSSLVSGRGNVGQTAYAFANCCCERIIEQRRYDGYPGISIQWGAIADVGAVINNVDDNQKVIAGSFPQRIASCLQTLDLFLSTDKITVASFVRADVKANVVSTDEDVIDAIARILGVHDSSQLNHDTLLIDLGLDSLMGVEIKQMLERNYEVNLSMKDIRTLSLAKLRTLVKSSKVNKAATGSAEIEKSTSPVDFKMDRVFATRFRIKFNELVPDNPCLKLNSNESGGNVFFVHPIEGLADNMIPLAKNLEYPVYCFQLTKDAPTDTIENLAQFYVKIMKSIQPKGPYRILGYSYGTVIAFEMALQLQQQKSDYVSSLILMDASHVVMKQYFKAYRNYYHLDDKNVLDQTLFESEVLCHLLLRFVVVDYVTILKRLLSMPSMQSRIDSVLEILLEHGFSINDKTVIRFGVEAYLKKILMLEKYNPSKMCNGDITLIRSLNETVHETVHSENTNKDFGLKEAITGTVHVQFVEGDHDTFIQENGAVKCARIITPLLL